MWAYFETTALVKRYVDEAGRREALRLLRRHAVVASALLPVELRGAIRRRVADGSLGAPRAPDIVKRVTADRAYWTFVEVGADALSGAERLITVHPLRTLDAIHVASAQLFAARANTPQLVFVSADLRQIQAAAASGMVVTHLG